MQQIGFGNIVITMYDDSSVLIDRPTEKVHIQPGELEVINQLQDRRNTEDFQG